jgi:hypothetical protein
MFRMCWSRISVVQVKVCLCLYHVVTKDVDMIKRLELDPIGVGRHLECRFLSIVVLMYRSEQVGCAAYCK